ncbi:MAG: type II secretion system protein [Candidatus Omnitrophica bacterium]|nr:type II secretion system protein [Candidatus Omnitrophota bacterium]
MKRGFTIIELLIVITVIAILIGIALPRFRGMQEEGNIAKAAGELRGLAAAVESYYIHNSRQYPSQGAAVNTSWQSAITGASPQIIGQILNDPFDAGVQYRYATDAGTNSDYYVIFSVGPDGAADITGVNGTGAIQGTPDDDIYISNGTSGTGGF